MALLPRQPAPPRHTPPERIEVSPDQVFQRDSSEKRFWELSFDGHVTHILIASFVITFVSLFGAAIFLVACTDVF
jgi:hypothetical protein